MDEEEWASVQEASRVVAELGENISILDDCGSSMTAAQIEDYIKQYVMTYEVCPVLIVDYLQILAAPEDVRVSTDKQIVDRNIARLRSIATKYQVPVIVISAFNRENYNAKVGLQAFKDSGGIEYSGDTMIGLQLTGVGEKDFDVDAAKAAYPRKVDLIILKQRYGAAGVRIPYRFYTKFNYFAEEELEELLQRTPVPFGSPNQNAQTAPTVEIVC